MKRKRYSEEQIISILKEHEAGMPAQEVIRKHGIANGTFYAGRKSSAHGDIDVKRLRELEAENAKLKRCSPRRYSTRRAGGRCAKKVVKPAQRRAVVG